MGHLSNGTEGNAHEDNFHSHHGEGKLLLIGRKHTKKCVLCPRPGIETIHIQLQTYNTLGSSILACTALNCLWLMLEPALLLCLSVLDMQPRGRPQLQGHLEKENAGNG